MCIAHYGPKKFFENPYGGSILIPWRGWFEAEKKSGNKWVGGIDVSRRVTAKFATVLWVLKVMIYYFSKNQNFDQKWPFFDQKIEFLGVQIYLFGLKCGGIDAEFNSIGVWLKIWIFYEIWNEIFWVPKKFFFVKKFLPKIWKIFFSDFNFGILIFAKMHPESFFSSYEYKAVIRELKKKNFFFRFSKKFTFFSIVN